MWETLDIWDKALFQLLNFEGGILLDSFMALVSSKLFWVPFYLLLLYGVYQRKGWKQMGLFLLVAVVAVALSDQLSSSLLKPWVERYRPCRQESGLSFPVFTVNGRCGGSYGFVSSHAANFFAMATVLSCWFEERRLRFLFFAVAALVAYSRVYLGVHYPGDVLGGAVVGSAMGVICIALYQLVSSKWQKKP